MDPIKHYLLRQTRRQFLGKAARGIGGMALASLLNPGTVQSTSVETWKGITNPTHGLPKVKRIIYLYMTGGGIKPGITYGATDDLGYNAVENVVTATW